MVIILISFLPVLRGPKLPSLMPCIDSLKSKNRSVFQRFSILTKEFQPDVFSSPSNWSDSPRGCPAKSDILQPSIWKHIIVMGKIPGRSGLQVRALGQRTVCLSYVVRACTCPNHPSLKKWISAFPRKKISGWNYQKKNWIFWVPSKKVLIWSTSSLTKSLQVSFSLQDTKISWYSKSLIAKLVNYSFKSTICL